MDTNKQAHLLQIMDLLQRETPQHICSLSSCVHDVTNALSSILACTTKHGEVHGSSSRGTWISQQDLHVHVKALNV